MTTKTTKTSRPHGMLRDYQTGEDIRPATESERNESRDAAETDGGAGVIEINGRRCFVEE